MAVLLRETTFCSGSYMSKDEGGSRLGSKPLEIDTVPGRYRGGEDAGLGP